MRPKIKELLPYFKFLPAVAAITVGGVCDDSREAKEGDLFFVRSGEKFDIFSVLGEVEKKARAFVLDKNDRNKAHGLKKPVIFVDDVKEAFHKAVDIFYGFNTRDFTFIGITGTNGKTTTAFLLHHALTRLGKNAALVSTVKYMVGRKTRPAVNTTPGYLVLRRLFQECKQKGARYIVMEASSHGIEQGRVEGIRFSACVFTNLTRDHLDYHKTFENYFAAKHKLFFDNPQAVAVVNNDDEYGHLILQTAGKKISFSEKGRADLLAENIVLSRSGTAFDVVYKGKRLAFKTCLLGRHNVYNILSAVGALLALHFGLEDILRALKSFKCVPGRLEAVGRDAFVDYAHTPDGLVQALKTLRECGYAHITCVFGCGGERDKGKRPMMGKIACEMADFSVITSDNPRSEDPQTIIDEVKKGFHKDNLTCFTDREKAIAYALKVKNQYKHSCLLAAGKGHEDYQVIGVNKIPYSDQKAIRKARRHAGTTY